MTDNTISDEQFEGKPSIHKHDLSEDTFPEGGLSSLEEINGFDVVRQEFLSSTFKAKITWNINKFSFNSACVRLIPDKSYVQMLFDEKSRRVVLLPCGQYDKDSLRWCNNRSGKPQPRDINAQMLCSKLFDFMEWIPEHRYKVMAVYQVLSGRELIVFNLLEYERIVPEEVISADGKVKKRIKKYYPPDWRDSFGTAYGEHKSTYEVNLDDYYLLSSFDSERMPKTPMREGQAPTPSEIITRQYYTPDEPDRKEVSNANTV